jgi:hypothetical protein
MALSNESEVDIFNHTLRKNQQGKNIMQNTVIRSTTSSEGVENIN